jgi:Cu+-exporting ATPase
MTADHTAITRPEPAANEQKEVTFSVSGMTCASCVRRIEKALSRVGGVEEASVNLATEKARVVFDPAAANLGQLKAAVEKAGYQVGSDRLSSPLQAIDTGSSAPAEQPTDAHQWARQQELDDLQRKWITSLTLGLGMMAVMYLPLGIEMEVLAPALLVIATVVQVWAGAVFYQAAWAAA